MSSKDKEVKPLEKLKQFFRSNKGGSGNFKGRVDFALTADFEKDLGPETPLNQRLKHIKDLSEAVLNNRLEDNAIERLWQCLHDLLRPDVAKEHRHQVFAFFRCLVQGQYDKLGIMRCHFFRIIECEDSPEDVGPRLELLVSLTDNGKDILYLEEVIGPFMLNWMPAVVLANKSYEFLSMLVNVIKYNAALIDEYVVKGLVENTCWLCCHSDKKALLVCLDVLDTVVCYTNLPPESLQTFVVALCRTVSYEQCVASSWKVMRNLLGTHLGHSTLYTMCSVLQQPELDDVRLIRGAVFYINMGLWGTHRVPTLKYTATSVLPSLLHALECNERLVVYEVILSVQRLVSKYGPELHDPAWGLVLTIVEHVIGYVESSEAPQPIISAHLHETLSSMEQLIDQGHFNGDVGRVFELTGRCWLSRPEASVLRLVSYLATAIVPTRSLWLVRLNTLLDKYLRQDARTTVRVKVMEVLANVIHNNRATYEDELIEHIVVPHMQHMDQDHDVAVRNAVAQLLVDLCCECETKRCLDLMDVLQKFLSRPFDQHTVDSPTIISETEVADVKTAVTGLVKIFTTKLYQLPSSHSIKAYKLLVNHLEAHYQRPAVFEYTSSIRYMIFECLLHIRASSLCHLGFRGPGPHGLLFSPYLAVDHKEADRGGSTTPPPMSPAPTAHPSCTVAYLSMTHACKAVISCLKQEKDWKVLQLILQEVPSVMRNKALILSRQGNDIDLLACALCSMVSDKSLCLPDTLRNTPLKFTRSEFHAFVFPVLASLASYHAYLEPSLQQRLIKCMEVGLNSRQCAKQCVTALTTCILEMRDAMYKLLPEVLLNLSKISATTHIAVPILEFLSTLTRLPKVFASFVGDQYMSVFAISLPYTNPFKYNHYTVSLAHHVIAVWFLKCRLPFRRDFVKFITTGLKANVLVPFEEGQLMKTDLVNEDSTNRKRASSLTEQGSRRQVRPLAAARAVDLKPPIDEALMTFHVELTETCVDLMARYTFNTCSALPKRHPTAEFLLSGGQSMTWLLGNKLITVTTSGCSQKALKNGLCDKCWLLCKADKGEPASPGADSDLNQSRRRAKANMQRTASTDPHPQEVPPPHRLSKQLSVDVDLRTPPPTVGGGGSAVSSPVDDAHKPLVQSEQPEASRLDQLLFGCKAPQRDEKNYCACWCQGWAEIYVRRPTGDMSWVMRIQNPSTFQSSPQDFPLEDITTLFLPSLTAKSDPPPSFEDFVCRKPASETLPESEYDAILDHHFEEPPAAMAPAAAPAAPGSHALQGGGSVPIAIPGAEGAQEEEEDAEYGDVEGKSRNPVRRSNSSPEMSATWKNPFLKDKKEGKQEQGGEEGETKKGKQSYKDPRVSCEAIPEEMIGLGTTPPAPSPVADGGADRNPGYLTVHSCPGPEGEGKQPTEPANRTVPASPTSLLVSPVSTGRGPLPASIGQSGLVTSRPPQSPKLTQKTSVPLSPLTVDVAGLKKPPGSATASPIDKTTHSMKEEAAARLDPSSLSPLAFKRDRGHTISVMSPVRKPRIDWSQMRRDASPRNKEGPRSGINPSYVFLQLYHNAHFHSTAEKPVLLSQGDMVQRSIKILDHIPPYETHKVGVLYVGPGQASDEPAILRNQFGSLRYAEFLQRLGSLVKLTEADPHNTFLGGLHRDGNDGKFAYIWQDDVMQVIFHVATLMPTKDSDSLCNGKKLHIGNDYVTIVYNESGEEYNIQTVKGQFNYACVIIQPLDHSTNQVTVKTKEELSDHIGHSEAKIVSDQNLAILTRQLALHANLASMISCSLKAKGQDPYASNWLERLRKIKRLRTKVLAEPSAVAANQSEGSHDDSTAAARSARRVHMDDFTEYT